MKKKRRLLQSDTFWGLAAALLVVLQFWWLPGEDGSASDSYSTTVDGKLGLYRTLSQLYPRVERDALQVVPSERGCMVLIAPDRYPNDDEQSTIYEFVYNGGTLLFAPNWDDPECEFRSLGIQTSKRLWTTANTVTASSAAPATTSSSPATPSNSVTPSSSESLDSDETTLPQAELPEVTPSESEPTNAKVVESDKDKRDDANSQAANTPTDPAAKSDNRKSSPFGPSRDEMGKKTPGLSPPPGIEPTEDDLESFSTPGEKVDASSDLVDGTVEWHSSADLQIPSYLATESLVKSSGDRVEVATWNMGQGRVIACSSPDIFSNRNMLYREPRRLAVRLVERGYLYSRNNTSQDPAIVLSEYFNASDAYQQTGVLFSPSLRIGTLQLVLVAVLGIWLAFYRFGPAEDVSTLQRRSLTESAQAVGNLQYRLQDGGAVIRGYLEYIRSQLRRRYGSIVRMDQPEALASRAGMDVEEVRTRLAEAQRLAESAQLSPEMTAASLRWLALFQRRLGGIRDDKQT